jgi:solute carrier family 45, member 1/2/4
MHRPSHPWGVFFTILGTVLLDFDADACQSPARAYLLDVTLPEDHATGLSTFTVMAGLGGFMGYSMGGINWDETFIGVLFGGHVRAVFSLITIIFIVCVSYTVTSFTEMPLWLIESGTYRPGEGDVEKIPMTEGGVENSYGALDDQGDAPQPQAPFNPFTAQEGEQAPPRPPPARPPLARQATEREYAAIDGTDTAETQFGEQAQQMPGAIGGHGGASEAVTLQHYLMSIILMPHSMRMVCLTNLFCWSAHVCYSLYFTDFVGEAVFGGDPKALEGDIKYELYEAGIRFGCWGMAMYSLSCACYSMVIERLIKMLGARKVYIGGLLFYSSGMTLMALTKHRVGVILFSWTAGVMYSTLFTMPYLLIANYHSQGTVSV